MSSVGAYGLGAILTIALLAGFAGGWTVARALRWAVPNVLVATLVLVTTSLGGPLLSHTVLSSGHLSYAAAVLIAGFGAGVTFWPMGETQGPRQWL